MTSRRPDWEARLAAFIEKNMRRSYEWGQWDCLLFSADAVKELTGKDHGRGHRGKYKSHASAYRHLRGMGFTSPEELLDSLFDEKPVGFAGRGDLVITSDGIPAVCMGAFALSVGEGQLGLLRVPRELWIKAWAIGEPPNVG